MTEKYRLITRSDFDGLVCAIVLKELDLIDDIKFVHPKDMQDGIIEITNKDITTNLPYVEGVFLAFDHHSSETARVGGKRDNHIIDPHAPSAARVVYDYYGGADKLPRVSSEMMDAVDKADFAQFTMEDVLNPKGWELLSFLMDSRTGLGRFREFRISNYNLMMELIDHCVDHPIEDILALDDVKERVDLYFKYSEEFKTQITENSTINGDILVVDLRNEEIIYPGNRFLKYAIFPESRISVQVIWGFKKQNTVFAIGKSIFDRSSKVDIGDVALEYGGGGHSAAGTCQVPNEDSDKLLVEVVEKLKSER